MTETDTRHDKTKQLIREFNEKHGVTKDNQLQMLMAELGELADENIKRDKDGVREEIGDVLFVAYSVADLWDVVADDMLHRVTLENMKKDTSKDGEKVTKDGLK